MKRGTLGILISILILIIALFLTNFIPLVSAQEFKLDISTTKETYSAGENITFKATLLDSENNPLNEPVDIFIEDAEKIIRIEKTSNANELVEINLGEDASFGYWSITAKYGESQTTALFIIEVKELAKFSIKGDTLAITNVGNTKYTRTVQIIIGDTISAKNPKLDMGESVYYRLVAPKGNYDIKITDGKTTFSKSSVQLTGTTGNVVGALDEAVANRAGITGGISPDEKNELGVMNYIKQSKLVYVFVIVVFGAMILLAIEKRFTR